MPIKGLTDNGASFPRIGELRKGEEKPAQGNRPGKDLECFRFTSKHNHVIETFGHYYPTGNHINVFLPFATTDDNFEAWQEEWVAGGLVHRCDGETAVIWRTGDGKYSHDPIPCPGGCSQVGRLKVIIPELGRLAYVVALTTSKWDITEIHANLTAYQALRGDLRGIPFILSRVPRMISTPAPDGKRVRREKWLIHIEAAPDWVNAQLISMKQAALPTVDQNTLMLTDGDFEPYEAVVDDFNQDIYPDEYGQAITVDGEIVEVEPQPDTRGEMTPQAQARRDPRKAVAKPESIFRVDDEIMLHGKNDEKPGTVTAVNGDMVTVLVDGNEYTVKADKLTLVDMVQS